MPRPFDTALRRHFTTDAHNPQKKCCNYCQSSISHTAAGMKRHLDKCANYLTSGAAEARPAPESRQRRESPAPPAAHEAKPHVHLPQGQKRLVDRSLAKAALLGGLPTSMFDSPILAAAFRALNQSYTPPKGEVIRNRFLPEMYTDYHRRIVDQINDADEIAIILDGSEDNGARRILSISVQLPDADRTCYFWQKVDLGSDRLPVSSHIAILKPILQNLVGGPERLYKIRTFCADTGITLQLAQRLLRDEPEFKHCWTVLCDANGLQLLIKDIVAMEPWKSLVSKARDLIVAFGRAQKQYGRLREAQRQVYHGVTKPFLLPSATRWNSPYRCCRAIQQNKEALVSFTLSEAVRLEMIDGPNQKMLQLVSNTVNDNHFWLYLDYLLEILKPVNTAIVATEAETSYLGHVIQRWNSVQLSWLRLSEHAQRFEGVNFDQLFATQRKRQAEQTTTINWVAWSLDYQTLNTTLDDYAYNQITSWLRQYALEGQSDHIVKEFDMFRNFQGPYAKNNLTTFKKPKELWVKRKVVGSVLADLALRLFNTMANSCPSERSFAATNFGHANRNNLPPESIDKLEFIHLNYRVLDGIGKKTWENIEESEEQDLEENVADRILDVPDSENPLYNDLDSLDL